MKNTLATIQAIAVVSLRDARSVDGFKEGFIGRIQAIARAHDWVVNGKTASSSLADLIRRQVNPYASRDEDALIVEGPSIVLTPTQVHCLGLILHELATNATKHGALARPGANVTIRWRLDPRAGRVLLGWTERGGPPVNVPERKGFGSRLVEQMTETLGGDFRAFFEREGFRAEVEFPLPR